MSIHAATISSALAMLPPCSFAPAIRKVHAMARDERCPASVLNAIIGNDPGMAFIVLTRANFPRPSDDAATLGIAASMNRLGIPATAAVLDELDVIPPHLQRPLSSFWTSASAATTMARTIMNHCPGRLFADTTLREVTWSASLFYDLGNLIAMRIFGEQYAAAAARLLSGESHFDLLLQEELGWGPGTLAKAYGLSWGLPHLLCESLEQQYRPTEEHPMQVVACTLHLVRSLVCACGYPSGVDHFVTPIDHRALAILGLRSQDMIPIVDSFFAEMRHLELYEVAPTVEVAADSNRPGRKRSTAS